MESKITTHIFALLLCTLLTLTGCAPIAEDSSPQAGSPIGLMTGAAVGLGVTAALNAPPPMVGIAGVAGASLGYYLTTLRFASGAILKLHGKVYTLGDYVIIEIPSDNLFDATTDDFLPGTDPALSGIVAVLNRYSDHNIIISGSTSGFGPPGYDQRLSQARAAKVASYLWMHGITDIKSGQSTDKSNVRRLIYIGYGDHYPIANHLRLRGIRSNSRIQIVAYPCNEVLHWNKKQRKDYKVFNNFAGSEPPAPSPQAQATIQHAEESSIAADYHSTDTEVPESTPYKEEIVAQSVPLTNTGLSESLKKEFADSTPYTPSQAQSEEHAEQVVDAVTAGGTYAYNSNPSSDAQTMVGNSVKKHWGFKGDNELKDETPIAPPTARG
jgi:hypothetical protein